MHGILLLELKKFVSTRLGGAAWGQLTQAAGLADRVYLPTRTYPDEEVARLVEAASRQTGRPAAALLEDFGQFIAPDLLRMYAHQIHPGWRTLDLIEHTEEAIHQVLRSVDPLADPPRLRATRQSADRVVLVYDSRRRLCNVGKGIIRGVAASFNETVRIEDHQCMLKGDPVCEILITHVANGRREAP